MDSPKNIVVAVTGASGSVYAQQLIGKLQSLTVNQAQIALIVSETPPASGSACFDAMVVIPCSMGTLGRIANGTSNDLISRSADVMLKEKKPLILVVRESPYNLIHLENMKQVTLAGGTIFPASPSFYSKPTNITEVLDTVVDRVLSTLGFNVDGYKWNG